MAQKSNQRFPFAMNSQEEEDLPFSKLQNLGSRQNEMMAELQTLDFLRVTSDHYVPDTFACNHYFLRFFPTDQMLRDFPIIANYILTHEYDKIYTPDVEEYLEDRDMVDSPNALNVNCFLNLLMTQAERGNTYAIDIFKNLYEIYYP